MNLFATLFGFLFGNVLVRFAKPFLIVLVGLFLLVLFAHVLHLDGAMRDAHARNLTRQHQPVAQ